MIKELIELIDTAVKKKELEKIFFGMDPYKYNGDRFSPAPKSTQLTTIFYSGIFPYFQDVRNQMKLPYLNETLLKTIDQYEGIYANVTFLLCFVNYRGYNKKDPLNIDITKISKNLEKSIRKHKHRLMKDKSNEYGAGFKLGCYEDLYRLSKIMIEDGGPAFFPEEDEYLFKENNQNEGMKI